MKKLYFLVFNLSFIIVSLLFLPSYKADAAVEIFVNEILPAPSSGSVNEYVELYNPNSIDIDLSSWELLDKNQFDSGKTNFIFKDYISTIKAKSYLLINSEQLNFGINDSSEIIYLRNGAEAAAVVLPTKTASKDQSWQRQADNSYAWATPTPLNIRYEKWPSSSRQVVFDIRHIISDDPNFEYKLYRFLEDKNPITSKPKLKGRINYTYLYSKNIYTARLIVTDKLNNKTFTFPETIEFATPNSPPKVSFSMSEEAYVGDKVLIDGSNSTDPDNDPLTFNWQISDGTSNTLPKFEKIFTTAGTYKITLTVKDSVGNTSSISQEIIIKDKPIIPPVQNYTIYINEFLPNPDGADSTDEWIELYNPNSIDINLINWQLDDIENSGSKPYVFNTDTIIKAKSYLVISIEDSGLNLNNTGTDYVRLTDPTGKVIHSVKYTDSDEGISYARKSDGNFAWTSTLTKGALNKFTSIITYSKTSSAKSTKTYSSSNNSSYKNSSYQTQSYVQAKSAPIVYEKVNISHELASIEKTKKKDSKDQNLFAWIFDFFKKAAWLERILWLLEIIVVLYLFWQIIELTLRKINSTTSETKK